MKPMACVAILSSVGELNGFVGQNDLDIVLGAWGASPPSNPLADPDGSGFVGQDDFDTELGDWGQGTTAPPGVPEPATLSLVLMGVMALVRRWRHRTVTPERSARQRNSRHTTRKRSGFTLVELLIVAGIIVLLVAILLPALGLAKELGNRAACAAQLRHMGIAMAVYADSYHGKLLYNYNPGHPYVAYYHNPLGHRHPNGKLIPVRLACLYEADLVSPRIFYCPTAGDGMYERYCNPAPWGTLPQEGNIKPGGGGNQWVRTSYTYYPQAVEKYSNGFPRLATRMEQLDPERSMITDNFWCWGSIPHSVYDNRPAICAVFGDGHAGICTNSEAFDPDLWFINPSLPDHSDSSNWKTIRPPDEEGRGMIEFQTILRLLSAEKG